MRSIRVLFEENGQREALAYGGNPSVRRVRGRRLNLSPPSPGSHLARRSMLATLSHKGRG
jgi:hypothetical protein